MPAARALLSSAKRSFPACLCSQARRSANVAHLSTSAAFESEVEAAKLAAATAALSELSDAHEVVGIGSGSTVVSVVAALKARAQELRLAERRFVPTGWQSRGLILQAGLQLAELDMVRRIGVTFDGADDVDAHLNAIKGGGACMLQEKLVAEKSDRFIIVADWRKQSKVLGGGEWKRGVPIEVSPPAAQSVLEALRRLDGSQGAQLRLAGASKAGPVVTDNANLVIDATFAENRMADPDALWRQLRLLTGVVDVGLFTSHADVAYFGRPDGTVNRITRK